MKKYSIGYVRISSAASLRARCDYIQDEKRRSHSLHRIVDVMTHGPFQSLADWIGRIAAAEKVIRGIASAGRHLAGIGMMYCMRFAAGTYLSDTERTRIFEALRPALHLDRGGFSAWHVHKYDGEADLHAIVAHVDWDLIPLIRPRSTLPHLPTLRKVVATTLRGVDEMRLELGVPTPPHSPAPEPPTLPAAKPLPEPEELTEALGQAFRKKRKPNIKSYVPPQDAPPIG
jgi:hypothetical protein